ncbi:MAG: hypothetical protein H8E83_08065 [Planctomycetes bacterium]|nr:hypothetical protein [Planctomycetota bacterium]
MLRKVIKWGCVTFVCIVLAYVVWVAIAMNRSVTISVDYVALLNEKSAAVPENQRAWPLYRDAGIALRKIPMPGEVYIEEEIEEPNWPDEEGWNHVNEWLLQHHKTLGSIRSASVLQGMGYILDGKVAEEDKELFPYQYASQQTLPSHDGFLVSILLPQLSPMRNLAKLVVADAKDAAISGDALRCEEDLRTMLLLGTHVREHPLLINDLVSFSIYNLAFTTLQEVLDKTPELLSQEQLDRLANELQTLDNHLAIQFEGEQMFLLDLLQRMYTDDGNGDGRIAPLDARDAFSQLEAVTVEVKSISLVPALFAPIADLCFASRKEMREEYERRISYFVQAQEEALEKQPGEYVFPTEPWVQPTSIINPYFLMDYLTPAYNKAIEHAVTTKNNRDILLERIKKPL